jgi:tRNA(fMet)-specific endonuclease VapC
VIDDFCHRLNAIVAWDAAAADHYARIQAKLLTAGTPIGANDAMIAGHALSTGATLVTNNQRHFQRVQSLTLENWAESR